MQIMFRNYSDKSNAKHFPDIDEVPSEVKIEAVIDPGSFEPPDNVVNFRAGAFHQRLIYYKDALNPQWTASEQTHLAAFAEFCATHHLAAFPDWYPEHEVLRMLYAEQMNYHKTHQGIINLI